MRREGKVSELTVIAPLKKGGAKRMRAFFETLHGNIGNEAVERVGTVHDMRWVFLDNDTKLLFASTYDGDWDPYIDDFATKIPDILDLQFGEIDGWPGVRNPAVKDFIVKYQVQAHFWYVANPNLTVVETRRAEKVGKAAEEFLTKWAEGGASALTPSSALDPSRGSAVDPRSSRDSGDCAALSTGAVLRHACLAPHRRCAERPRVPAPTRAPCRFRGRLVECGQRLDFSRHQLYRSGGIEACLRSRCKVFPRHFRVGMAGRADALLDRGENDPKNWDQPFGSGRIHLAISIFSDTEEKWRRAMELARRQYHDAVRS